MTRTILVVEDNPITRKMMRFALEAKGYRVLDASDGQAAELAAAEGHPDLALLDLLLPDCNGCDLVPKLRALPGGDRMSILACSGLVSKAEEARMSAAGFDDVVMKPVEPSRLLQVIRAHLPEDQPSGDRFGQGRRLLVVDDDPIQLKLAAMRLARHGFDTITAGDGAEALDMARLQVPDAIVTDVLMPRVDGFQLCREVRQDAKLAHVPVVMVTNSYVEKRDRELARGIGATDLLLRTPELRDVAELLRTALAQRGAAPTLDPVSLRTLDVERTKRALHQLEKQVAVNAGLAQRCANLAAEVSVLRGISAALAEGHDPSAALDVVLAACLDAGGISEGGLYLFQPDGSLQLRAQIGRNGPVLRPEDLADGAAELGRALDGAKTLVCSATGPHQRVLDERGLGSALMVPLTHQGRALGALVLATGGEELLQEERIAFAEAVANQMALAVTLARTFAEQTASEQRAREGEATLRSILESIPDAVLVVDRSSAFTHWNGAGEVLVKARQPNQSLGEWVGRLGLLLGDQRTECPPDDLPLARALRGESVQRADLFMRGPSTPDGVWLSVNALPLLGEDARPYGAVAVFRDVTGERNTQAQLMLSDRLASVGMLAAGVAHEINNPLAAVLANLQLAIDDLAQPVEAERTEEVMAELRDAREAAMRVRDIVKDVRIFSRGEDQTQDPVDVRRVLDSTLRMAWNEIRHRARLVKDYHDVPAVLANESRLGQALLNLIVNAAHAIDAGRANENEIRVGTGMDATGAVLVTVTDTGSGMPPEVLSRLFTPFFTTKPRTVGTGLGLAITHRIISSLGGTISVESAVGRGTTFRVIIPASAAPESRRGELPSTKPVTRRGRVLVIDDEPFIGNAVRRTLELDHEVVVEANAPAALARIAAGERFDAILCDLMMPVMTGMDVHAELARTAPEQAERVVFFTGGAFTSEARTFLARVANRKLEKPFEPAELRRLVALLVG
jgi:CheY-like chemotaxis protein